MADSSQRHPTSKARCWPPPPGKVSLEKGAVHLWCASLRQPDALIDDLRRSLTPDESERAGRFHFRRHREAYVVSRGLLRAIAGGYLNVGPGELRFNYTRYGKPCLGGAHADSTLRFNLSHSHELALFAFCDGAEVGVDIEHLRPGVAGEQIAERFFSPREVETFKSLASGQREEAFFRCWTRKEAFIKAVGEGLSYPLDGFDVSFEPEEPAALLSVRNDAREAARWTLRDVSPAPGYVAALAVEGRDWRVRRWRWQS